jgi:hypothetical protein
VNLNLIGDTVVREQTGKSMLFKPNTTMAYLCTCSTDANHLVASLRFIAYASSPIRIGQQQMTSLRFIAYSSSPIRIGQQQITARFIEQATFKLFHLINGFVSGLNQRNTHTEIHTIVIPSRW